MTGLSGLCWPSGGGPWALILRCTSTSANAPLPAEAGLSVSGSGFQDVALFYSLKACGPNGRMNMAAPCSLPRSWKFAPQLFREPSQKSSLSYLPGFCQNSVFTCQWRSVPISGPRLSSNSRFYGFLWPRPTLYVLGVGGLAMLLLFAGPLPGKPPRNRAGIRGLGLHRAGSQHLDSRFSASLSDLTSGNSEAFRPHPLFLWPPGSWDHDATAGTPPCFPTWTPLSPPQ